MKLVGLSTLTAVLLLVASVSVAGAQTVWLAPMPDQITPQGFLVDPDYQQLFEDGATWPHALSHTRVFAIDRRYIATQPEPNLQRIFAFLRNHGIALAVIFGFVPANNCGQDVEGTAHRPDENFLVARRAKRLGGDLVYAVVDEALVWGHYFHGRNACQYSIDELAAGFAREARQVRSVFPGAEMVDTETSSGIPSMDEFGQWLDALKRELGDGAPKVVSFDVQWYRPWQQTIPPMIATLRQHGLGYGVIYKGTYLDRTDAQYIVSTQQHIKDWQATVAEHPDRVLFQSWEPNPTKILPETSPTTLTYLVNWYCTQTTVPGGCK
jgi:hypothetical protein